MNSYLFGQVATGFGLRVTHVVVTHLDILVVDMLRLLTFAKNDAIELRDISNVYLIEKLQ